MALKTPEGAIVGAVGLRKLECSTCGASLEPAAGADTVTCRYCNSTFRVPSRSTRASPEAMSLPAPRQVYAKGTLAAVIVPFAVMLLAGVGMAVTFVVRSAGSPASPIVSVPTRGQSTGPGVRPGSLGSAPGPDLAAKLDLYVTRCFNRVSPSVLRSRYRYLDWVDPEAGPSSRSRHVYGLYEVSEPSDCREAVAEAAAIEPPRPELEEAARSYLGAAAKAHEAVADAYVYYERENYRDDDFARGKELHAPLMGAFSDFVEAHEALEARIDAAFDEVLGRRADALARGEDDAGLLLLQSQLEARRLAEMSNVRWGDPGSIDLDEYQTLVGGYEQMIDRLADVGAADEGYVGASRELAQAAKELMRRRRDGRGWSTGERSTLRAGRFSHWMVDGSPGKVVDAYNDVLGEGPAPHLRWVAPVEFLSGEPPSR